MHTDAPSIGTTIGMFSLISPCVMDLAKTGHPPSIQLLLEPKSLLIMKEEVRYEWEHGINPSDFGNFGNSKIQKDKRFSLVFWKKGPSSSSSKPRIHPSIRLIR